MREVLPGVYGFHNLLVGRVYAIQDPDGLTLIDAGMPLAARRILSQLAAAGYQPQDVKRILITHAHADHIGGLPALQASTGADVIASCIEAPIVEGREPQQVVPRQQLKPLDRLMRGNQEEGSLLPGTPITRMLEDGEQLPNIMDGLQAILTPGHTPGHTAFWQPERRVLFCGDAIMHFFTLSGPFQGYSCDLQDIEHSIKKLAALAPQVVCFGHGKPLFDAADAIAAFADRFTI